MFLRWKYICKRTERENRTAHISHSGSYNPQSFCKNSGNTLPFSFAACLRYKTQKCRNLIPASIFQKELYLYNLVFLTLTVTATSVISQIFSESGILSRLVFVLNSLTLLFSIFGFTMLFSGLGRDGFGWALFIIILDAVLGGLGSYNINSPSFNPYSLISFTHQGNVILSFLHPV